MIVTADLGIRTHIQQPASSAKINFSYSILFHLTTPYSSYFGGKKGISRNKTSFFLLMTRLITILAMYETARAYPRITPYVYFLFYLILCSFLRGSRLMY